MPAVTADVAAAVLRLRAGQPVAIPTETVYGLAACADSDAAVEEVYRLKDRPAAHPLILHLADAAAMDKYAAELPPPAGRLAQEFMPGPLTLLLPRKPGAAERAAAGGPLIGLRVPSHPLASRLIREAGCALAAPSANHFGHISPTCAAHVATDFADCPDLLILDGGPCEVGLESTIVLADGKRFEVIRPGSITLREIERAARMPAAAGSGLDVAAPGTLRRHYSSRQPLRVVGRKELEQAAGDCAAIGFDAAPAGARIYIRLPARADAAARELYAALRAAEASGCALILMEKPPAGQDWEALRDRIGKAAAGS